MIRLNADGTLSVQAATLTAQEVEQLITQLAKLRAQMAPPVPTTLSPDAALSLVPQLNPDIKLAHNRAGTVSLGMRHQGLGWLVFQLPPTKAADLHSILGSLLSALPSAKEPGGRNLTQH